MKRSILGVCLAFAAALAIAQWSAGPLPTLASCTSVLQTAAAASAISAGTYTCTGPTVAPSTSNVTVTAPTPASSPASTPPVTPPPSNATALALAISIGGGWGVDAPTDADQSAYLANPGPYQSGSQSYPERGGSPANPTSIAAITSKVTNANSGGGTRFGVETVDGLPAIRNMVVLGDSIQHNGLRSGIAADNYKINHGEDHWFAYAYKLSSEWGRLAMPSGTAVVFSATHTGPQSSGFTGAGLLWQFANVFGGKVQTNNMWLSTPNYSGGSSMLRYSWAANIGGWQRVIVHQRSGNNNPILEAWVANGTGAYTKLSPAVDPYRGSAWPANAAFGDPIGGGAQGSSDYLKNEIYVLFNTNLGGQKQLILWNSGMFAGKGANLYDNAVASLTKYAIAVSGASIN